MLFSLMNETNVRHLPRLQAELKVSISQFLEPVNDVEWVNSKGRSAAGLMSGWTAGGKVQNASVNSRDPGEPERDLLLPYHGHKGHVKQETQETHTHTQKKYSKIQGHDHGRDTLPSSFVKWEIYPGSSDYKKELTQKG